jgi:hypothetical protein
MKKLLFMLLMCSSQSSACTFPASNEDVIYLKCESHGFENTYIYRLNIKENSVLDMSISNIQPKKGELEVLENQYKLTFPFADSVIGKTIIINRWTQEFTIMTGRILDFSSVYFESVGVCSSVKDVVF